MATSVCLKRLRKDLRDFQKSPPLGLRTRPLEDNILEWNFVIEGAVGSDYEGGFYHGRLSFPPEFPLKPPSIQMLTPNGRFSINTRICLSMTDFHPESWNPMWSTTTILVGFQSFMLEQASTYGSINSSSAAKRQFAADSLEYNIRNKTFVALFPELVAEAKRRRAIATSMTSDGTPNPNGACGAAAGLTLQDSASAGGGALVLPLLVALLAVVVGSFYMILMS